MKTPYDDGRDPTDLEDAILGLLEEAGIDTEINDQIMRLVEQGERRKYEAEQESTVAGEIMGSRVAIIGETLADALNVDTWTEVANTIPSRTPEQEAEAQCQLEEWERSVKANPPKRIV